MNAIGVGRIAASGNGTIATLNPMALNAEHRQELHQAIQDLFARYRDFPPDPDGEPYSFAAILHPDLNPPHA